jgi:flagellar basal-body rod modification protein FlgD
MESVNGLSELFPVTENPNTRKSNPNELGQDDFMTLMVAQLENQDPTKPMDNTEFLAQIAQFGTVSGIQELQDQLVNLSSAMYSSQTLQATNLVGRHVVTNSNVGVLGQEGVLGANVELPADSPAVTLYVQDSGGRLVFSQPLGAVPAGDLPVLWDGTNSEGERQPPGNYRISAEAQIGNQSQAVSVFAYNRVMSVTIDNGGGSVQLNLDGGAHVDVNSVKSIL